MWNNYHVNVHNGYTDFYILDVCEWILYQIIKALKYMHTSNIYIFIHIFDNAFLNLCICYKTCNIFINFELFKIMINLK